MDALAELAGVDAEITLPAGAPLWQVAGPASFGPTSAIPGVVFTGSGGGGLAPWIRSFRASDGVELDRFSLNNVSVASGTAADDGTVVMGAGIGTRSAGGSSPGDVVASLASAIRALCVSGTAGCGACNDGVDNDMDGLIDAEFDDGCVDEQDNSEVLGDTNYDNEIDDRDQARFYSAFGRAPGDPGYVVAADLDPPGAPDGIVGLVDWQLWLEAEEAARQAEAGPGCGLLGAEPLLLLGAVQLLRRRRRTRPRGRHGWLALLALVLVAATGPGSDAAALATLSLNPAPGTVIVNDRVIVPVGETFEVEIFGDLSLPIVGFGLDAEHDEALLLLSQTLVGPSWTPVASADGDDIAGLAILPGISGNTLLATLTFEGLMPGLSDLTLSLTLGDPTEGFALPTPGEFDDVDFGLPLEVRVIPEPASAALLVAGLAWLAHQRRRG